MRCIFHLNTLRQSFHSHVRTQRALSSTHTSPARLDTSCVQKVANAGNIAVVRWFVAKLARRDARVQVHNKARRVCSSEYLLYFCAAPWMKHTRRVNTYIYRQRTYLCTCIYFSASCCLSAWALSLAGAEIMCATISLFAICTLPAESVSLLTAQCVCVCFVCPGFAISARESAGRRASRTLRTTAEMPLND